MEATDDATQEKNIFRILVKRFRGRCTLPTLEGVLGEKYGRKMGSYLGHFPELFVVHASGRGGDFMVTVRLPELKLCADYVAGNECRHDNCQDLHVCRNYIEGYCSRFVCPMFHNCSDDHNEAVIARLELEEYSQEDIICIIRCSLLQVCEFYNKAVCPFSDRCTRLHVCAGYVRDTCTDHNEPADADDRVERCTKAHRFTAPHERRLLQYFDLAGKNEKEIKSSLLVYRRKPENRGVVDLEELLLGFGQHPRRRLVVGEAGVDEDEDDDGAVAGGVTDEDMALILAMEDEDAMPQEMILKAIKASLEAAPAAEEDDVEGGGRAGRQGGVADAVREGREAEGAVESDDDDPEPVVLGRWRPILQPRRAPAGPALVTPPLGLAVPASNAKTPALTPPAPAPAPAPAAMSTELQAEAAAPESAAPSRKRYTFSRLLAHPQDAVKAVCLANLDGVCPSRSHEDCARAHVKTTYLWQLRIRDRWLSVAEACQARAERAYCDPAKTSVLVLIPDSAPIYLRDAEVEIDFLELRGLLRLGDVRQNHVDVRRLSTASRQELQAAKSSRHATHWRWYHQQQADGVWIPFLEVLESTLEKRLLDGKANCRYSVAGEGGVPAQRYEVSLRDMTESNRKTGFTLPVRRRPHWRD